MRHAIGLPATSRRVPISAYVEGIRLAKANPDATFRHGLTTWWPVSGAEIVREFRAALDARINRHDRRAGRKLQPGYQEGLMRDSRRIADYCQHRIVDPVNRLETPELQTRFGWRYEDGLTITFYSSQTR